MIGNGERLTSIGVEEAGRAQLQLGLEDLEQSIAMAEAATQAAQPGGRPAPTSRRNRGNLPKDLPREEIVIEPESKACPCCGGAMHSRERHDLGFADHGNGFEVKGVDGFAGRQSGFGKMAFDAPPRALGDLMLGERGKEARRRPSFLVGLGGKVGPDQLDGRQPQLGQEQRDAGYPGTLARELPRLAETIVRSCVGQS